MKIDFDNLQDLSDNKLMQAWHERMAKVYHNYEILQNGTKKQKRALIPHAIQLNGEMGLLRTEITRRECEPIDPDQIKAIINLDLN